MGPVSQFVADETGYRVTKISNELDAAIVREDVHALLARPLTADAAVQIALLNNRGLQAAYNELGISEADYVEASLPPNPTISLARIATTGELEIERRVVASLLALLTLPARRERARLEFESTQFATIDATLRLAADTRKAYFRAVAAQERVVFLNQAAESARIASELTTRLRDTGAAPKVAEARAQALEAEIAAEVVRARLAAKLQRETLLRLLGLLESEPQMRLPGQLPALGRLATQESVEAVAIQRRVDLIADRLRLDASWRALRTDEATRYVSLLELAGIANTVVVEEHGETERVHPIGFELEFEIPIFDGGEVRIRRSEERYLKQLNELVAKAVEVRSEARGAYATYRSTYQVALLYRDRIVPLRQVISEEVLLQYNGMLVDVFDLLTAARESVASNTAAIDARRDFLIAEVDFAASLVGGFGEPAQPSDGDAPAETQAEGH